MTNKAKCECCAKKHDMSYGSGRFCSSLCARSFSTKRNRSEISAKVSKTLAGRQMPEDERLKHVGIKHSKETKLKIAESVHQAMTREVREAISSSVIASYSEEQRQISSARSRKSAAARSQNRWHTRRGVESRNERVVREYFESMGIPFEQEVACGPYSLDFVIVKRRKEIDVEIDGRQHKLRIASDLVRDNYVTSLGYKVARFSMSFPVNDIQMDKFKTSFASFLRSL